MSDIEFIDGFNIKTATKLFDSIVEERTEEKSEPSGKSNKIKGQILQPQMSEEVRNVSNLIYFWLVNITIK